MAFQSPAFIIFINVCVCARACACVVSNRSYYTQSVFVCLAGFQKKIIFLSRHNVDNVFSVIYEVTFRILFRFNPVFEILKYFHLCHIVTNKRCIKCCYLQLFPHDE